MSARVAQGAILLAISLATLGAIVNASDWTGPPDGSTSAAAGGSAGDGTAELIDEGAVTAQPAFDVPLRSGRIGDEVVTDAVRPVAVRIAGIEMEAPVISVGVDEQNQFAVPAADTVGWYQYSASPGDPGATVLAAHVDYGGVPGAFFNLEKVLPGDTLEVEMEDGRVLLYRVVGNTEYDKVDLPAEELFRKDGEPVLQLITCGGTFNPQERSYEANVVVTAVPIVAPPAA